MELKENNNSSFWQGKHGPMLIAEIGGNHEGNFEKAKELTNLAIGSGVDCVKFQIYTGASLVNADLSPDRFAHFRKFELEQHHHIYLADMCTEAGVQYLASVWDPDAFGWIQNYLKFFKIGSGDLTAYPLLEIVAKKEKPILLSTGLSTEKEVMDSVTFIRNVNSYYNNPETICLLQCTAMYPIEEGEANLAVMERLAELCNTVVGYSDHTTSSKALVTAAIMGAKVLEFHFTDTRENQSFRDHHVSLINREVQELIEEIKRGVIIRGDPEKKPTYSELENNHNVSFRRGVYLRSPVLKGDVISQENLAYLRPFFGTCASKFQRVVGSTALTDIAPNEPLVENTNFQKNE